ncbi:hypothetical protein SDC9_137408 [bioreactor metagenome]|uniref:Uncharacterized protein n=1 Tax=bioreactor metagenome TaxID=1076179 RepID=A0A645DLY0_9ZZZZ
MEFRLIVTIFSKDNSFNELKHLLAYTFKTEPIETKLPISGEINATIQNYRGNSKDYELFINSPSIENAVFDLLIQLETFGYDWKFRKPIKLFDNKYTFVADLFPEFGTFYSQNLCGMVAILNEL